MKNISISEVVKTAIKKVEAMAKVKQIKIENNVKNVKIHGLADRLIETFVILLDNSIKYSSKKSSIRVTSQKIDDIVRISITDHGIGISEEDLPRIFDRFYRGEKSRTEDGYGLGLAIAKKIIVSHKGSITVRSRPGEKTEFLVTLPSA